MRWKEVPYQNFIHSFLSVMPGGRARGNPAQIFSEISQKFLPTDLKNFMVFVILMWPPFTWYMNFGPAPLHLDFSIFGPLCSRLTFHSIITMTCNLMKRIQFSTATQQYSESKSAKMESRIIEKMGTKWGIIKYIWFEISLWPHKSLFWFFLKFYLLGVMLNSRSLHFHDSWWF